MMSDYDSESNEKPYVRKEIVNKKRTLQSMRKNKNKRDNEKKSIFPLNNLYIFTELIKKQNRQILERIAEDFIHGEEEREKFIDEYSKNNYIIPDVGDDENERIQSMLNKTMK
jgi:hypothetical protein